MTDQRLSTDWRLPPARRMPPLHRAVVRRAVLDAVAGPDTSRGRFRPGRWMVVAAGGVALGFAAVAIPALTSDQGAYASWTAVPTAVDASRLATLGTSCSDRLASHFPDRTDGLRPVLADQRGRFTAVVLDGGGQLGLCMDGMGDGQLGGLLEVGTATDETGLTVEATPGLVTGPDAAREVVGRVSSSDVTSVVVQTADGRYVTASVAGGVYLAWWPSGADPVRVTGRDSGGRVRAVVEPPASDSSPRQR